MKRWILRLIVVVTVCGVGWAVSPAMADDPRPANATVSFGQWRTDFEPPLDRVTVPIPPMGAGNNHELLPNLVTIEEGGAVNFIIGGVHNPQIYNRGTKPEDISTASPLPGVAGGIINDANHRIFRGLDPNVNLNSQDRVEVVYFEEPGTYLVICGVVNHFVNDRMFGFVEVLREKDKK